MFHAVVPAIENLFASDNPLRRPVPFGWRLIRRKRRPFLLLPTRMNDVRVGLELYSAQRPLARMWRRVLPWLFRTPAASLFEQVRYEADAGSAFMRFLAQQSGVTPDRVFTPAIKFGGLAQRSRLVLLLCDETRRPFCVVKVGLDAEGREITDREADLLEKLPAGSLGCIRMTGRLKTPALSAFATAFFSGACPANDAGMEHLFHAWLQPDQPLPLAALPSWRELADNVGEADHQAWRVLNAALAGQTVQPTLYHGDFAPWNIRAVNTQNLQAFDWERGHLQGVPGWDWFHFIAQTALLARRHSVERTAAELEQLLDSERFKKYAAAAGIRDIARPLLLAYLFHQKWVVKPLEGGRATAELFKLLAARWQIISTSRKTPGSTPAQPGLQAGALLQLKSAGIQLSNLFWEPSLTARTRTPMSARLSRQWPVFLLSCLLFLGIASLHYSSSVHLLFIPFYLVPCALLTWKMDRRWGMMMAGASAMAGPLIQSAKDAGYDRPDILIWNMAMRFITLQLCVLFVAQTHECKTVLRNPPPDLAPAILSRHWAVVLASGLLLLIVAMLDFVADPHMVFIPLYLLPCIIFTLALDFRWGMAAALLSAGTASLVEYLTNPAYGTGEVFGWNALMRLATFLFVVLLLERIRHGNILFAGRHHEETPPPGN